MADVIFSKHIKVSGGQKTSALFVEKILTGIYKRLDEVPEEYLEATSNDVLIGRVRPKIHTIRKPSKKYKKGLKMEFYQNQKKFSEVECTGIESLILEAKEEEGSNSQIILFRINKKIFGEIRINGGVMVHLDKQVKTLIENDGFNRVVDFLAYFKLGTYQIVHWTQNKYEQADTEELSPV